MLLPKLTASHLTLPLLTSGDKSTKLFWLGKNEFLGKDLFAQAAPIPLHGLELSGASVLHPGLQPCSVSFQRLGGLALCRA